MHFNFCVRTGETAVVGNNVSMLHHVTLGGTGKSGGDRHPKIGDGVLLGCNATVLGNVKLGDGVIVGACSVVLKDVPSHSVVVGVPAKVVKTIKTKKGEGTEKSIIEPPGVDISSFAEYCI